MLQLIAAPTPTAPPEPASTPTHPETDSQTSASESFGSSELMSCYANVLGQEKLLQMIDRRVEPSAFDKFRMMPFLLAHGVDLVAVVGRVPGL